MVTHDPKAASRAKHALHLEKGQLAEGSYGYDVEKAAGA